MAVVLIDTNVLVYAHDRGEPAKQEQAIRVLDALEVTGNGRLTAQVLGEFFRATTKPPSLMLTQEQAQQQIDHFIWDWICKSYKADAPGLKRHAADLSVVFVKGRCHLKAEPSCVPSRRGDKGLSPIGR